MVCGVEFDADTEVWWDGFAGFGYDVQDEFGSLFCGASVGVCAVVCLFCEMLS